MRLDHRLRDPAAARLGALSLAEEKKGCHPNDLKSLMRQPLLHKEKHCATRELLVTHFHRRPQRIDTCDGETAVTGGLIDRFQLADQ